MQLSRLFEIVYILLQKRRVTAGELAERFGVSVRTIYRDVEKLSMAGVPVYALQGLKGGLAISDSYVLSKSLLTDAEQAEILVALKSLSATGHADAGALLSRLASLFDKESAQWIEVDFSNWGEDGSRQAFADIKAGLLQRRALRIDYHSTQGEMTRRTVYPLRLVYKARTWYLQAFCTLRGEHRTFKLARMGRIALLDDAFDPAALLPPPELATSWGEEYPMRPVRMRFAPGIAWQVYDQFASGEITPLADGALEVRTHLRQDGALMGFLMGFGADMELLAPADLRALLAKTLAKTLAPYQT
ncbi:MAG: YafY family transcriptional regulator [Oscillospiraceae bacterium]|jgi:predicted DNA-binding transcriptional regulator YafY|nr:YafY family transcriptional regulator [Oscillospiraceae bacterium]